MRPAGRVALVSAVAGRHVLPSAEYPTMLDGCAFANATSTGHGSWATAGETVSTTAGPDVARETVDPNGIAPGCHVTVAAPSGVTTAPASAGCATAEPGTAAGTGAATIGAVVTAVAEVEPPFPVAVTTSEMVTPISPGVSVYVDDIAPTTAVQLAPVASQRRHWYENDVGAPLHVPTELVSVCPACAVPVTVGSVVAAGRVTVPPPAVTATVAGDAALTMPVSVCAVTSSTSACPTSTVTGTYVSAVAPVIGTQLPPAASQRCHW